MAVVGIIVFCGVLVGLFAWLLNRTERPKDPERGRRTGRISYGMEQESWEE